MYQEKDLMVYCIMVTYSGTYIDGKLIDMYDLEDLAGCKLGKTTQ